MVTKTLVIKNNSGLHARPAASLSNFVKNYDGEVNIHLGNQVGDAKSILNLLSMGISKGTEITLSVDGKNEEEYINEVIDFINKLEG